jgi:hypothetical protein
MPFEQILDQAIAMLQRRRRVSYRTLKLQFNLDEEHLEALIEALIEEEQLAVDEARKVLVWTPREPVYRRRRRRSPSAMSSCFSWRVWLALSMP